MARDASPNAHRAGWAEMQRMRRLASLVGRLEAILALLILALAIMLVRGTPFVR